MSHAVPQTTGREGTTGNIVSTVDSSFNPAAASASTLPNVESSPFKKQKLFVSPILLPLATSIPRLTSASPPSPISFVSPTAIEFDELSQAFNSSCRCQVGKQNLNTGQQKEHKHQHLDVQKIYAKLAESNHAASFPISSASSSPPGAPRCSCIQLSVATSSVTANNASVTNSSSSTPLKRRYDNACTPSTPVSEFNSFSLASASASPPMDSSYERAYVRVKKSSSATSGLVAPAAPAGTAVMPSSSSSFIATVALLSHPNVNNMHKNRNDRDSASPADDSESPFEDDSISPPVLAAYNGAPTLSSAASTASMSPSHLPVIPQSTDVATSSSGKAFSSSKPTTAATKPASTPAMEYNDEDDNEAYYHSAVDMDEIFRLEDEENESELQFLMNTKLGQGQPDEHHMPYIL